MFYRNIAELRRLNKSQAIKAKKHGLQNFTNLGSLVVSPVVLVCMKLMGFSRTPDFEC